MKKAIAAAALAPAGAFFSPVPGATPTHYSHATEPTIYSVPVQPVTYLGGGIEVQQSTVNQNQSGWSDVAMIAATGAVVGYVAGSKSMQKSQEVTAAAEDFDEEAMATVYIAGPEPTIAA
jgi:hypothetical protein